MKNRKFLLILANLLICLSVNLNIAKSQEMNNSEPYDTKWKEIDKLLNEDNLPKSALDKINEIWNFAVKQQNEPQQVKALIYWSNATSKVSENTKDTLLPVWLENVDKASGAHKAVLQSVLAEMIWNYLENNRWTINGRTNTEGFIKNDMATWSERDFENTSSELYLASVGDLEKLNIGVDKFAAVIHGGVNTESLRPLLSDVLIARAIDHFTNTRTQLSKPVNPFRLNDPILFDDVEKFTEHVFVSNDTVSPDYKLITLMQRWLALHLKNNNSDALLDVDLQRLDFTFSNSTLKQKTEFYRDALNRLLEKNKSDKRSAEIYSRLVNSYMQTGAEWDGRSETRKWDLKTAHDLALTSIKLFPGTYGAATCQTYLNQILIPTLETTFEVTNLPQKPVLAYLVFGNVKSFQARIIKNSEAIKKALAEFNDQGNVEGALNFLKSLESLQNINLSLPVPGDYRKHSIEYRIDPLKSGEYIVLFSSSPTFGSGEGVATNYASLQVSKLAVMVGDQDEKTSILVTDRYSGEPLKGVLVKVTEVRNVYSGNNWNLTKSVRFNNLKTDKKGFLILDLSKKENDYNTSFLIEVSKGDDRLEISTDGNQRQYKGADNAYIQTYLYTDRSIYRPGQTIYFKGLLVSKKGMKSNVVANEKISIGFFNANSQKVEEKKFRTDEFGSFDGFFVAPTAGMNGQMHLNSDRGGVQWFSVEEYKRPTFEVVFDKIEGEFKLNDLVTIKAKAQAFAGNTLTGAAVSYRVFRKTSFPFWYFYRYMPGNISTQEIINGTAKTNEEGYFSFRFPLVPDDTDDPERKPIYTYEIVADITDQAGETRTGSAQVAAGYVSVNVDVKIEENYSRDSSLVIDFKTTNLAGQATSVNSLVKISRLTAPGFLIKSKYWDQPEFQLLTENEYRKNFPNFAFAKENNPESWQSEPAIFSAEYKESTLIGIDASKWKPGKYKFSIEIRDNSGNPVTVERYFTLLSDNNADNFTNYGLSINTDKDAYEPGDVVKITIESPGIKYPVWVEMIKKNEVVASYWLNVKNSERIETQITEEDRGNFSFRFYYVFDNRKFEEYRIVKVPWKNKDLKIEYVSFRDKLLPGSGESWKIKISGFAKDKVMADLTATMYDASLDVFRMHSWSSRFFDENNYSRSRYNYFGFGPLSQNAWGRLPDLSIPERAYPFLDYFGYYPSLSDQQQRFMDSRVMMSMAPEGAQEGKDTGAYRGNKAKIAAKAEDMVMDGADAGAGAPPAGEQKTAKPEFSVRQNLKETVFFIPIVNTDPDGNYVLDFKMNEALTKWKLLLFAHTKDLAYAFDSKIVVTQKDLMIQPNMPRFLRQGDTIQLSARISNLSEKQLDGLASIQIVDALTGQDVTRLFCSNIESSFLVNAKQNTSTGWNVIVPANWTNPIDYKVIAMSGSIADGEGGTLPVLTDKILVTETLPLPVRAGQTKTFTLKSLKENTSKSLQHVQYVLEFTPNPVWYAVKALPYLSEYPHDCSEQIFSRLYANVLASYVANRNPAFKEYYDKWKSADGLQSKLSLNQDLKNTLLEETPWVQNALSEEDQMQKISLLFDMSRIRNETKSAISKLLERQQADGGFAWFPGGRSDWFITQYIIEGFEHLNRLKVLPATDDYTSLLNRGKGFIDNRFVENFLNLEKLVKDGKAKMEDDHLSDIVLHYMYTSSFDLKRERTGDLKRAYNYYLEQAEKFWTKRTYYQQGLMALITHRNNLTATAQKIVKSLKENAIYNEELGMYWKTNRGYYWYEMPVETQSLMIEVFDEVASDQKSVDELRVWLLKNKQTNHWKTTKATSEAIYALLLTGSDWITETKMPEIKVGAEKLDLSMVKKEPGTGYFKKSFPKEAIGSNLSRIEVTNPNKSIAWGGIYWQYFESMDKVKTFEETPLKINKTYFIVKNTDAGPVMKPVASSNPVKLGDKVRVRIEIRVDRMMEYVHLKDLRGSGFEPVNVLSQYKYQGGLGYYESTRDAATDFFISYLPKGTYVFEYDLRAGNKGTFSMGISTMQCMYAPEFSSHSAGERIGIE